MHLKLIPLWPSSSHSPLFKKEAALPNFYLQEERDYIYCFLLPGFSGNLACVVDSWSLSMSSWERSFPPQNKNFLNIKNILPFRRKSKSALSQFGVQEIHHRLCLPNNDCERVSDILWESSIVKQSWFTNYSMCSKQLQSRNVYKFTHGWELLDV